MERATAVTGKIKDMNGMRAYSCEPGAVARDTNVSAFGVLTVLIETEPIVVQYSSVCALTALIERALIGTVGS